MRVVLFVRECVCGFVISAVSFASAAGRLWRCIYRCLILLFFPRLLHEHFCCGCFSVRSLAQGDQERALGMPISSMMDRTKPNIARSQLGFIDFIVRPTFEQYARICPEMQVMRRMLSVWFSPCLIENMLE